MCFCACTPQTDAKHAWDAVTQLHDLDYFETGSFEEIAFVLREAGVRFHKNKTKYILTNRDTFFPNTKAILSELVLGNDISMTRDTLVHQVAGWGLKEASHFLRNTGWGGEVCILDRHIMKQLCEYGVLAAIPATLSKPVYLKIEQDMKQFALDEHIPVDALDLVFWYQEKGEIFR
jgi:N-glycosylase/DNA lyase